MVTIDGSVNPNNFYNVYIAADVSHYFQTIIQNNNCYSTAGQYHFGMGVPLGGYINGGYGFNIKTPRYNQISVTIPKMPLFFGYKFQHAPAI